MKQYKREIASRGDITGKGAREEASEKAGAARLEALRQSAIRQEAEDNEGNEAEREPEAKAEDIERSGGITTHNRGGSIHAIIIAGQIEGHYAASPQTKSTKYEQCIPTLVAVEESDEIDGLLLLLNTIGGDVEAGLAMAELIAGMQKPTVSLVLGGGHSIGVPLAVSAKKSFIVPSATMTLHPVRMNGLVIGVPQTFANFSKMQDRILEFIVRNSRASKDRLRELMTSTDEMTTDIGTVIDGAEAVSLGLIDAVGGLGDALAALKGMIAERTVDKSAGSVYTVASRRKRGIQDAGADHNRPGRRDQ